jgi:hypothetical protein
MVLVSRRNRPNSGLETGSNEGSLLMSRFCVDFRYLNSNTQAFLYTIPNVDELTGSFTRHIPNFISSIDFRSGFFQMLISGAILPWLNSSSSWWRNTSLLWGGNFYGLWCLETASGFRCIIVKANLLHMSPNVLNVCVVLYKIDVNF